MSLLGCLKPLPEFERIIFFSLMSFNRHSIQRTAAAAFMALWIDSAFAWLGDFVLFFWLAFRKFSGKKGIAPCDDKSNAHFVHLISVGNRFEFASIIMCAIELISPYFNTASNSFEPPMQTNITLWEKWHMNLHFHMRWIFDCKFLVVCMKTEKYPIRFYRYFRLQLAPFYLYKFHG